MSQTVHVSASISCDRVDAIMCHTPIDDPHGCALRISDVLRSSGEGSKTRCRRVDEVEGREVAYVIIQEFWLRLHCFRALSLWRD